MTRNLEKLSFTWNVTSILDNEIKFQINFDFAEEISMGKGPDLLIIEIINLEENQQLFVSDDGTKSLNPASFVMIKELLK